MADSPLQRIIRELRRRKPFMTEPEADIERMRERGV